jgi:hypothetical protein
MTMTETETETEPKRDEHARWFAGLLADELDRFTYDDNAIVRLGDLREWLRGFARYVPGRVPIDEQAIGWSLGGGNYSSWCLIEEGKHQSRAERCRIQTAELERCAAALRDDAEREEAEEEWRTKRPYWAP